MSVPIGPTRPITSSGPGVAERKSWIGAPPEDAGGLFSVDADFLAAVFLVWRLGLALPLLP
jgi:hypothetical protein